MKLAPIVLFTYNRPLHTKQTLDALALNPEAKDSILYIYCDGAKEQADNETLRKIREVRAIANSENRFRNVTVVEQEQNKGLADSIIEGVTKIVNQHETIIVLEDDIVASRGFLKYMNDALDTYRPDTRVMHITGYMYPHQSKKLPETFFYSLPYPGGGWATWSRAWKFYNNDTRFLYNYFEENKLWYEFNTAGGNQFQSQLESNLNGKIKTWFIKWHASLVMQGGLTLFPRKSLIHNIGFDNSGVHCGTTTAFDGEVTQSVAVKRVEINSSKLAEEIIKNFYLQLTRPKKVSIKQRIKRKILNSIPFKNLAKRIFAKIMYSSIPQLSVLKSEDNNWFLLKSMKMNTVLGKNATLHKPFKVKNVEIGSYTYISQNSLINHTKIGKFCSVGPNVICGWGVHPVKTLSTSPMFYSTQKQNGITFSDTDKIEELIPINIGNDVFIGMNVTILDGITIGDGAIIGAGAVVSKDIPPYAIAVGNPVNIIRYRFSETQIEQLLKIKWWNFEEEKLKEVERYFFNIDEFIEKYKNA
jgi:acetyltransferase-like isoleucine patch superfamily enzyme